MTESRWLTRMPVYDLETGRVVGRIRRLIVDPDERRVVGLLLATRLGKEAQCLPFRELHAVGEHAVTVRGLEAITPLSEQPDMVEVLRSRRRIYHAPVLTEGGRFLGDVDEFTVNPRTGRVEALFVSGGLIRDLFRGQAVLPAHVVLTIGEDAVIVRDQAVAFLKPSAASDRGLRREPANVAISPPDARDAGEPPSLSKGHRFKAALTWWRSRRAAVARKAGREETAFAHNAAGDTPGASAEAQAAPPPDGAPPPPAPPGSSTS
ncbi:MAG TPA: PRC-barrel domain-containing protein [Limnochordales bacterium]